jgi:hypothetical protein
MYNDVDEDEEVDPELLAELQGEDDLFDALQALADACNADEDEDVFADDNDGDISDADDAADAPAAAAAAAPAAPSDDYDNLTSEQLTAELRRRGLGYTGTKAVRVARLCKHDVLLQQIAPDQTLEARTGRFLQLSRDDLKQQLTEHGVSFSRHATKGELVEKLLSATDPVAIAARIDRHIWLEDPPAGSLFVPPFAPRSEGPIASELGDARTPLELLLQLLLLPPELKQAHAAELPVDVAAVQMNDFIDLLVFETNRYARQPPKSAADGSPPKRKSHAWSYGGEVTREEMLCFMGLSVFMGCHRVPTLSS